MSTIESPLEAPLDLRTELLARVPDYAAPGKSAKPDYLMPELCEETKSYRRIWLVAALGIFALYAMLVFSYWGAADSGVDQNAYLVGGRLLAEHFSMKYTLPNPYAYTGGMFVRVTPVDADGLPVPGGDYYPKYPFGLPLLYACVFWAFKVASVLPFLKHHVDPAQAAYWAFLVSPVSAVLGVAGTFFLARQVAGSFAGALAAILLGSSQLMMMLADNPNSHESCLAFIVWGMFFCVRWLQTGSHWRGIVGGLLVGYAATIRYNEGLLFASMCVVVLGRLPWNQRKTWRSASIAVALAMIIAAIEVPAENHTDMMEKNGTIAALSVYFLAVLGLSIAWLQAGDWFMYLRALVPGLAWSVPVGALMLVNHHTMGSFTGYDSTHESEFGAAFKWEFFWQNWEKVLRIVYDLGLFFVLPFAVAGVFMLFKRSWRVAMMLIAWIVPGVMLYMSYYWSPDVADAYARFFLTYMPALCVGAAVCFYDGVLFARKDSRRYGGTALTISAGVVVAIASGISMFRTIHGLREGVQSMKIPLHDFRERLALSQTGQVLLDKVPANSVLFAEDAGGISTPANYIQFLNDWEMYSVDAFSSAGSRRGMGGGGGGGGNRQRNNGNNGNNNNFNNNRRGGGPGGNGNGGGGRGNFGGPGGGGPGGGGNFGGRNFGGGPPGGGNFGGGPPGGGGFGGGNANGQTDTTTTDVARPTQPEQEDYHASLYRNKSARQLYQLEADVINNAFAEHRKVFMVVAKDHITTDYSTSSFERMLGNGSVNSVSDSLESFREDLQELGGKASKLQYKIVARWQDVALPEDKPEDFVLTDNSPMGGGQFARMLMSNDQVYDWQLVEITAPAAK